MVILGQALRVVGQDLDYPALGDPATPTLPHHSLKLALEHSQAGDPRLDLPQVSARNSVRLLARSVWIVVQRQQLSHRVQREPQFPAVTNERESVGMSFPIKTLIA